VVTRGEPIEAGARVRVIEVEGNRVVVARENPIPPVERAQPNNPTSERESDLSS
jgi:hypothetical protein